MDMKKISENYKILESMSVEGIPFPDRVRAFYESTRAAADLSKQIILPQLKALIKPTRKEEILKGLYYRIYAYVYSLVELKCNFIHFQVVASATRSIFELSTDIKLIIDENPKNFIQKFDAFIDVEKFRVATKYTNFKSRNPKIKYIAGAAKESLANKLGEKQRTEKLRELWGRNKENKLKNPDHWTGWDTSKRAKEAGIDYELFYHESFSLMSWYIHSGLTGVLGRSEEGYGLIVGNAHRLIAPMFLDTTLLIAREFKILAAIPSLDKWVRESKLIVGKVILEELNRQVEEKKLQSGN